MLRSDLWDYSDAYIVVNGRLSIRGTNNANRTNKKLTFKNNAPFRSCISKINSTFIDNAEDLDIVMPMYNLLEYSNNYPMTSGRFRNYYRDEVKDDKNENDNRNNIINNNKTTTSQSFEYKTKIERSTPNKNNILDAQICCSIKIFE